MQRSAVLACGLLAATPALANDSIAELTTGGLILSRTDAIAMEKEELSISAEKVTVDYVFRNQTDADVDAIVAFPMPTISGNPYEMPALPDNTSDNFLGFQVSFDGKAVQPKLEQRASAVGIDITDELAKNNVPINPFTDASRNALEKLSEAAARDWIDRGLIFIDSYDDGSGMKNVRTPLWALQSTYWWTSHFPASQAVKVHHTYQPSLGGSAGLSFFFDGKFQETYAEYKTKYCMDDAFEKAILRAAKASQDNYAGFMEERIDYVLTSGGNWALGNIADFKLTVDKGDPRNLISFCAPNVRKTGATTFEATATDFYPTQDIAILILKPTDIDGDASRSLPVAERKLEGAAKALAKRAEARRAGPKPE